MMRFDEKAATPNSNGQWSREALEAQVRALENDNQRLQAELQQAKESADINLQELEWYYSLGLPSTESEMLERARTGPTIRDVLAECERECRR